MTYARLDGLNLSYEDRAAGTGRRWCCCTASRSRAGLNWGPHLGAFDPNYPENDVASRLDSLLWASPTAPNADEI
jgi:hypothetical protein